MKQPDGTLPLGSGESTVRFARYRLVVESGDDAPTECWCEEQSMAVGKDPGNQLQLRDATVSRHHFCMRVTAGGMLLRDLGSTNGTHINGVTVREAMVKPGDIITAGRTRIRFDLGAEQVEQLLSGAHQFDCVLGRSKPMRRLFALLPKLAAAEAPLLLTGETGTGKTQLAKAIHRQGARARGPFVVVDCASIPANLIESELFGHVRGAFTGAVASRQGAFEAAAGGTLFLDEIGEMPLELQPKLLTVLEERAIRPVGSDQPRKLDFRLITATNRELRTAVNQGTFRADLYYRLNTLAVELPPLRDRREDVALLVHHFYAELASGEPPPELVQFCERTDWPGNVRELKSAVTRTVLLGDPDVWESLTREGTAADAGAAAPTSLPEGTAASAVAVTGDEIDPDSSFRVAKERAIVEWELWYLRRLMEAHDGNLSAASRTAQMDRKYLRALLKKHQLTS